ALRLRAVATTEQATKRFGDDLPRQAVFVLEPAATTGCAVRGELVPVVIDLLLRLAPHEERDGLVEHERRAGIQGHELLPLQLELDGHHLAPCAIDRDDLRALEDRGV